MRDLNDDTAFYARPLKMLENRPMEVEDDYQKGKPSTLTIDDNVEKHSQLVAYK